jgi:N-acetylneuraminate synthase
MKKTFIIAEIGINHNGDLNTAKRLIDISAAAGCDAVKFQKRNPDICVPEHQKSVVRETPWGEMTYLDYKNKIEFGRKEYDEINNHCEKQGIAWSASPWDVDSLDFINQYNIPFIKIASASLTDHALLIKTCLTGKKIIISTGMSSEKEIDNAVRVLKDNQLNDIAILHCNSSYPAPIEELNLSCIKTLKEKYGCEVGYSGHEFRLGTSVAAIYMGATIIERHVTLDRTMWGSDHMASVEPQGLFKLVRGIRELEKAYGDGNISVTETEKKVRQKLRNSK